MCSKPINVIGLNLCWILKKYSLCPLCASGNQMSGGGGGGGGATPSEGQVYMCVLRL